jgi:hypothetical protein
MVIEEADGKETECTSAKPVLPHEHLEVPHKILRKLVAKEELE